MGWCRHPKTTQERRRWYSDIELIKEYPELKLRSSRAAHLLPNLYDDIFKGAWEDRSWKRHRFTQYGVVRSTKKNNHSRSHFNTPLVPMHSWRWGAFRRDKLKLWPYRVRFKYIKNKTA